VTQNLSRLLAPFDRSRGQNGHKPPEQEVGGEPQDLSADVDLRPGYGYLSYDVVSNRFFQE